MNAPQSVRRNLWFVTNLCTVLVFLFLALGSPSAWAANACSSSMGKVTLNEYNHQGNFVEVKTLVSGTSRSGWSVRIYSSSSSSNTLPLNNSANQVCGKYEVATFGSSQTPPDADVVLFDNVGDVVDILRGRTGSSLTGFYSKPACAYVGPSTDLTGVLNSNKGIDRQPDGTGGWRNTPGTGAGSFATKCAGNSANTASNVDLVMGKTVSPAAIALNANATFTLTLSNNGPNTATSVQIADTMPAGLSYVSHTAPTVGTFSAAYFLWDIPTLASGASASMTITVKGTSAGTFTNTASAASDNNETNSPNNTASATLAVQPSISITSASAVEGNLGTTLMTFTLTQSAVSSIASTVTYTTSSGTATGGTCGTAGVDYGSTSGTATLAAGQTTTSFTVPVCGDTSYEGDESFTVTLVSPVNATLAVANASGTILNDDAPPLKAEYHFDETVWNGTSGEVKDSSGNNHHATAALSITATGVPGPAYASASQSTCRYGVFDVGTVSKSYVELPGSFPGLSGSFSLTAWINSSDVTAGHQRIFVRDDADNGWALSLADGTGTSVLRFFNRNVTFASPTGGVVSAGGVAIDTAFLLSSNTWYFVALTVDTVGKTAVMYAYDTAGIQKSKMSATFSGTWGAGTGATAIGGETAASSEGRQASWHFLGRIDEVRIYSGALTQTLVEALLPMVRPCVAVDHVRLEHDGQGLSCQNETLTVTACADADAGSPAACTAYTGGISGNVLVKNGSTVLATIPFTIGTGNSSVTVSAAVASTPSVTFETNALSIVPSGTSPWTCWNSVTTSASCSMAVGACVGGSNFNCLDSTISPYTGGSARLYSKLAGTAFHFDVVALNSAGAQESNYSASGGATRPVTVELFDDTTPAASCSAYSSPIASQTLTFSSTDGGRKQIAGVTFAPAYQKLLCRVTDTSGPSPVYGCSSDDFAVRPLQLTVSAPVMSNPALTDAPKATAGSAFTLTAAAGVTAGYTGTPLLDPSKVQDHAGTTVATGTLSGAFSPGSGTSATGAAFKYLDVGNIKLLADAVLDNGFTSVDQVGDCVTGSTSNSLSGGKYGCNIGSAATANMGRWYPSHYSFVGSLTPACGSGGFTYMGQDALGVSLLLKAHASTGGAAAATDPVVSRYTTGSIPASNLAAVTISGDNGGTAVAVTRLGSPAFPAMPNTALWAAGQFLINDTFLFSKLVAPDGPYGAFKLKASVNDPDGSVLIGSASETNLTQIRYGRLRLQNAYGSELLALPMPLEAQYWAGNYYLTNTVDSCTVLPMSSITMGSYLKQLNACETQLTPVGDVALVAGKLPGAGLVLTKPGASNAGSVNLAINVSATAAGTTCVAASESAATAANMPWFGPNLAARATFGIYKSPLIYRRENY